MHEHRGSKPPTGRSPTSSRSRSCVTPPRSGPEAINRLLPLCQPQRSLSVDTDPCVPLSAAWTPEGQQTSAGTGDEPARMVRVTVLASLRATRTTEQNPRRFRRRPAGRAPVHATTEQEHLMADPQDDARTTQEILEQVARTLNIRSYDLAPPEVMAKFEAAYHEHCALPTPDGIHNHKLSLASIASALGD